MRIRAFRGAAAPRCPPGDALAAAVLVLLPVLVFGIPALLGMSVLPGDDLTQNFPLRVLAGQQISAGHLPLFDPYIWSGAPLLSGWNAGAAYPFTLLFAVLPGAAAWALNLIVTWVTAGLGMFWFLRAQRLGGLAAFLGALCFAFAGAMPAQIGHFGLVAGVSWVPVQLLAVLRLTQDRSRASRLSWVCVLAAAFGLTILAGEPRAIDDACVIVFLYAGWRIVRAGRRSGPAALSVAVGLGLGICLGAVQLLPGLAAVSTSQRAASSMALYSSGSLAPKWLLLLLVPDLLGGSGSFGQPAFLASYNLAEVTSYVGILPVAGAAALLGRLRLRSRPPEWLIWHLIVLAGIVCALGSKTPAGHLLVHVPLFGDQRLQSRNIAVVDVALAVLFAHWADDPFGTADRGEAAGPQPGQAGRRRRAVQTALGVLPPLAAVALVAAGVLWPAGLLRWLGAGSRAVSASGSIVPWMLPYAGLGAAAAGFVLVGRRLRPRLRSRLMTGFVALDLVVFALLAVVAVGARHGPAGPADQARTTAAKPASGTAVRPIAALGYPGRYAIYDPGLLASGQLAVLGAPDLNVLSATPSVQGYSSIVDGTYAAATGSHQATGNGQDVLAPRAIADGTLARLNTSVLLTLPQYLVTAAGHGNGAAGQAAAGRRDLAPGQRATWYLGAPLQVTRVEVPDSAARDAAGSTRVGLLGPGGSTRWLPVRAAGASMLVVSPAAPVTSVAVVVQAGGKAASLGPPVLVTADGSALVADGELQDALVPPQWGFAGQDGSFGVFVDREASGALTLGATSGRGGRAAGGASVTAIRGPADEPTAAAVRSPAGVRVTRSVAATPGWSATWHPQTGQPAPLPVRSDGVVQTVDVPAGRGVVTWSYRPPGLWAGLAVSAVGLAIVVVLMLLAGRSRRRGRALAREAAGADAGERRTVMPLEHSQSGPGSRAGTAPG